MSTNKKNKVQIKICTRDYIKNYVRVTQRKTSQEIKNNSFGNQNYFNSIY